MTSKRAPATFAAALFLLSACVPSRPVTVTPTPLATVPSIVLLEPELLGESVELEPVIRAASNDILGNVRYDLPMESNSWVEAELNFLTTARRDVIARWLARGDYYESFVERVFTGHGIPSDLHHLGMIESGFVANARSRVGATGFWQFMPATARGLGLRIEDNVDERMDPVRSTRAAARHLRSLYRELGDWSLAAAAYNAGSGRINRGMAAFGANNFWDLASRGDLAAETKQYVPRLYAMTVIGRDRERFGFARSASSGFAFDSVQIEYAVPFSELARMSELTMEELTSMNPHLIGQSTPSGGYWLWVPAGKGVALQVAWMASDFRKEQGYGTYTVRRGDTLGELAELAGLRTARVRELNPSVNFDRLQIGERLRLPYRVAQQLASRQEREVSASRPASREASEGRSSSQSEAGAHTVNEGETLSEIAERYDITVAQLRSANAIEGTTIRVGQVLKLPGSAVVASSSSRRASPEVAEHVVRNGESLWTIARQYRTTVIAIQDANELGERPIQPGQKLNVPVMN